MEVDLKSVRDVFEDLLSGRMSREQADRWAHSIVQHQEANSLVFLPPADKTQIWAGVMFLYGVDAMETPGKYLHTDDDIRMAMNSKLERM